MPCPDCVLLQQQVTELEVQVTAGLRDQLTLSEQLATAQADLSELQALHRDKYDRWKQAQAEVGRLKDAAEMLWVVLANVSGGDWTKQTQEWQEAAARWRDNYMEVAHPKQEAQRGAS